MADGRHIENRFGCISALYCPINAKFGVRKQNDPRRQIRKVNGKFRKFKMT